MIDAILDDDKQRPAKQRHTAKRVWERLREEHPFTGGYTIVKDYMRLAAQRGARDVRAADASGWGGAVGLSTPATRIGRRGPRTSAKLSSRSAAWSRRRTILRWTYPHSDDCFVIAFPAQTTEAFLEGHVRAFEYFGGDPVAIAREYRKLYEQVMIAKAA